MKRLNDYECKDCGTINERYWDVDDKVGPTCSECGGATIRHLAAPNISYAGAKSFRQRVPDGFKDVLKQIDKTTPDHYKAGKISAL